MDAVIKVIARLEHDIEDDKGRTVKFVLEGKQLTPQEREWMERPISIAEIVRGLRRKR